MGGEGAAGLWDGDRVLNVPVLCWEGNETWFLEGGLSVRNMDVGRFSPVLGKNAHAYAVASKRPSSFKC